MQEPAGDPGPWRQQALLDRGRWNADALRDMVTDHEGHLDTETLSLYPLNRGNLKSIENDICLFRIRLSRQTDSHP